MTQKDEFGIRYSDDYKKVIECSPYTAQGECHIREGVEVIGKEAFNGCVKLSKIIIPQSVTRIESSAFTKCAGISIIECYAINPPSCGEQSFPKVVSRNAQLYVPQNSLNQYLNARIWRGFRIIMPIEENQPMTQTDVSIDEIQYNQDLQNSRIAKMSINQFLKYVDKKYPNHKIVNRNNGLLSFFNGGEDLVFRVIQTNKEDLRAMCKKKAVIGAFENLTDCIKSELQNERQYLEEEQRQNDAWNDFINHSCLQMSISLLLDQEEFTKTNVTPRLKSKLAELGCETIFDAIVLDKKNPLKKVLAKECGNLWERTKQRLKENIDDWDKWYNNYLEDQEPHELPASIEENASLIERVKIAIKQLCEAWQNKVLTDREIRNIKAIERVLIGNASIKDAAREMKCKSPNVGLLIPKFVQQFMSGTSSTLVENFYITEDLINEISLCAEECQYDNGTKLCDKLGIDSVTELDQYEQILHYFFNLDPIRKSEKNREAFLDNETLFYIPDSNGKESLEKNVLQPIYKFLQKQYKPLSSIEILEQLVVVEKREHDCLKDIELFEKILKGYNKIEVIRQLYQLHISEKSKIIRPACIAYEELYIKGRDSINKTEIHEILNQVISNPSIPDKFTNWKGLWKKSETLSDAPSMYMYIYDYAQKNEVVDVKNLIQLVGEYYPGSKSTSVRSILRRFCIGDDKNTDIYCFESAVGKHTDHHWRTRRDGSARNEVIQRIYELIEKSDKPVRTSKLKLDIEELGYGAALYYAILHTYSQSDDFKDENTSLESLNSNSPFILKRTKGEKKRGCNIDYYISINPNFDKEDLKFLGYRSDVQFRQLIVARVIETLRSAPNQTCERKELALACKSLFEENDKKSINIIHNILYHHLPKDIVEWHLDGNKVYFRLLTSEEETREAPIVENVDNQIIVKEELPITSRPEPNKAIFLHELNHLMQPYLTIRRLDLEKSIKEFVNFLWDTQASRLGDRLRQYLYEYLAYRVDKYFIYSAYSEALIDYEKYIRLLYEKFTGERISRSMGLVDTINEIDCLDKFVRNDRSKMRSIYESVRTNRNKISHGEDLSDDIEYLSISTSDALALYVYTYALMKNGLQ